MSNDMIFPSDNNSLVNATAIKKVVKETTAGPSPKSEDVVGQVKPTDVDRQPVATHDELRQEIEGLNKMMREQGRHVSFSIDEQLDQRVVRVVDNDSGEVIRQIPSEQMMHAMKQIHRVMGLLFDRRA